MARHSFSLASWAQFRFSVIGALLSSPPESRKLGEALDQLAEKSWQHPIHKGKLFKVARSTLERWYYEARDAQNPVEVLGRKVRRDTGVARMLNSKLLAELHNSHKAHSSWSYQLHFDNLEALVAEKPELGAVPSYNTVRRAMQSHGLFKHKTPRKRETQGQTIARIRRESLEVRGYEASHVHALWHSDYHHGSLRVLTASGEWKVPVVLCVLDDKSRLCCHIQWYLAETAENFVHGLSQAIFKRGLPREFMTDNGSPMMAAETLNGLLGLSIEHSPTLPYSPYQNGKQESFWGNLEGRLMALLENIQPLTLDFLNQATQAWAECEYNRKEHSELGCSPLEAALKGPEVSRPAPEVDELNLAFCDEKGRTQRRSDGTIAIHGVRFELPNRLRTFRRVTVRFQRWNLSQAFVVDPKSRSVLARIIPQDKTQNGLGERRSLEPLDTPLAQDETPTDPKPPLLRKLLADYAATGLIPAYIPKDESDV